MKLLALPAGAGLALGRVRADTVHTMGAIVPNHADVASVQFCSAGFLAATRRLAPSGAGGGLAETGIRTGERGRDGEERGPGPAEIAREDERPFGTSGRVLHAEANDRGAQDVARVGIGGVGAGRNFLSLTVADRSAAERTD